MAGEPEKRFERAKPADRQHSTCTAHAVRSDCRGAADRKRELRQPLAVEDRPAPAGDCDSYGSRSSAHSARASISDGERLARSAWRHGRPSACLLGTACDGAAEAKRSSEPPAVWHRPVGAGLRHRHVTPYRVCLRIVTCDRTQLSKDPRGFAARANRGRTGAPCHANPSGAHRRRTRAFSRAGVWRRAALAQLMARAGRRSRIQPKRASDCSCLAAAEPVRLGREPEPLLLATARQPASDSRDGISKSGHRTSLERKLHFA